MKKALNSLKVFRWVTVVLMVAIIALQFAPNWENYSISSYLWFPEDTTEAIAAIVGTSISIDDIVVVALCQLIGGLVGLYLYLTKKRGPFAGLVPMIAGGAGVVACLTQPVYQGGVMFLPILAVSIAALLVGTTMFVIGIINIVTEEVEEI